MKQKITGYHQDFENHWVAELECGHGHHVRHDPPFVERIWATTETGRQERLGSVLNCVRCDELGMLVAQAVVQKCKATLIEAYDEGGISGLCEEGRFELAVGALNSIDLNKVTEAALAAK